mgnify:CR=1 FL=1
MVVLPTYFVVGCLKCHTSWNGNIGMSDLLHFTTGLSFGRKKFFPKISKNIHMMTSFDDVITVFWLWHRPVIFGQFGSYGRIVLQYCRKVNESTFVSMGDTS